VTSSGVVADKEDRVCIKVYLRVELLCVNVCK
jgi:hypothetical protein